MFIRIYSFACAYNQLFLVLRPYSFSLTVFTKTSSQTAVLPARGNSLRAKLIVLPCRVNSLQIYHELWRICFDVCLSVSNFLFLLVIFIDMFILIIRFLLFSLIVPVPLFIISLSLSVNLSFMHTYINNVSIFVFFLDFRF